MVNNMDDDDVVFRYMTHAGPLPTPPTPSKEEVKETLRKTAEQVRTSGYGYLGYRFRVDTQDPERLEYLKNKLKNTGVLTLNESLELVTEIDRLREIEKVFYKTLQEQVSLLSSSIEKLRKQRERPKGK